MNGITPVLGPVEYVTAFLLCLLLPHLGKFAGRFIESKLVIRSLFAAQGLLCLLIFFSLPSLGPCLVSAVVVFSWTFIAGVCSRLLSDLLAPMLITNRDKAIQMSWFGVFGMIALVLSSALITNLNLVSGLYVFMACILDIIVRSGFRFAAFLEPHRQKKSFWPLVAGIIRVITVLVALAVLISPLFLLRYSTDIFQMLHCMLMAEGMRQLYRALVDPRSADRPKKRID